MWLKFALLAVVVAGALIPEFAQRIEAEIQNISASFTKGTIGTIGNEWLYLAAAGGVLGLIFLAAQAKTSEKLGLGKPGAPPLESVHVAAPPTFGGSSGYTVGRGGVAIESRSEAHAGGSSGGGFGSGGTPVSRNTRKVTKVTKRSGFSG